jgi:hypothetical protein
VAQARQHSALIALTAWAITAGAAQAAPDAGACVAEHAQAAEAEGGSADAAREAFAACAKREFGVAAEARAPRCAADLYVLPVILLYRGDGLSKTGALDDLKTGGQIGDGSEDARRTRLMLDFAYQGAGPAEGKTQAWLHQRAVQWTDRCLRGRTN